MRARAIGTGSAVDRDLVLEFADPLLRRRQLRSFSAAQAGFEATVDAVLTSPVVDRLAADPEVLSDLGDPAAALDQIQHPSPELGRISTSSHGVLPEDNNLKIQQSDST